MGRRPNPSTPKVIYRGVTIRLYRHRSSWKAAFKIHGQSRRECYGQTERAAREAAQIAIGNELDPTVIEAGKDDLTARAILSEHGVSLTEAARYWVTKHSKPLIAAPVEVIRTKWLELRTKTQRYHHAKSLRARSRHFEEAFIGRKIATITLPELVLWQDSLELKLEGRTVTPKLKRRAQQRI